MRFPSKEGIFARQNSKVELEFFLWIKNILITIGKMAKANNVSISTLRLYDEIGLIKPVFIDPQTNYRYYDVNQTSRLDLIRYMRDMGMSIKDISLLLEKEDIVLIEEKLVERSIQIRNEIKALKSTQDAVIEQ